MEENRHRLIDADDMLAELKKMIDLIDSAMSSRLLSYEDKYRMDIQRNTLLKVCALCVSPELMKKDKPEEGFALKKGNWYLCIKDVCMNDNPERVAYTKGGVYQCLADDTLPDDYGNDYHHWGEDSEQEKYFRPWTINDAKDGDVLATGGGGVIMRFKGLTLTGYVVSHCHFENNAISESKFVIAEEYWIKDYIHPATEEQCELLDREVHQAGFEWDCRKHVLVEMPDVDRTIEQAKELSKILENQTGVGKTILDLALEISTDYEALISNRDLMSYIEKYTPVFLEEARKQLRPEIGAEIETAYKNADKMQFKKGYEKAVDEIEEALLSEVLPCFMHGGEADEVVAKLSEVLSKKKQLWHEQGYQAPHTSF